MALPKNISNANAKVILLSDKTMKPRWAYEFNLFKNPSSFVKILILYYTDVMFE